MSLVQAGLPGIGVPDSYTGLTIPGQATQKAAQTTGAPSAPPTTTVTTTTTTPVAASPTSTVTQSFSIASPQLTGTPTTATPIGSSNQSPTQTGLSSATSSSQSAQSTAVLKCRRIRTLVRVDPNQGYSENQGYGGQSYNQGSSQADSSQGYNH